MSKPTPLAPSKLGTKEYWDALYAHELTNHAHDPSDTGTVWFDDSDAEARIIDFLSDLCSDRQSEFGIDEATTSFLDLGTGNGSLLFGLRDAGWQGRMLGVDYSATSVDFARRIAEERRRQAHGGEDNGNRLAWGEEGTAEDTDTGKKGGETDTKTGQDVTEDQETPQPTFAEHDILHTPPTALTTAPGPPLPPPGAWDVVLDKGTFDAISLSSETDAATGRRAGEGYRDRILPLVREGGLFLVTSCNWTEDELRSWFVVGDGNDNNNDNNNGSSESRLDGQEQDQGNGDGEDMWGFEVVGRVEYRSFSFGGMKGQTISSLCFRKVGIAGNGRGS